MVDFYGKKKMPVSNEDSETISKNLNANESSKDEQNLSRSLSNKFQEKSDAFDDRDKLLGDENVLIIESPN